MPSRAALDSSTIRAATVILVIFAIYLWCTWSFIAIWWGDYGLWMHEVDRVASGEVPYRDFSWEYPPLALYLYATAVRWFGSDVSVLLTLSAGICLALFVAYLFFVRSLVDRALLTMVVTATLLTSVAYSSIESETLASGMYTPAAPLGGLLTLLAALVFLRLTDRVEPIAVVVLGVLLALAVLAKPDFWVPSACILAFAVVRVWRGAGPGLALTLGVVCAAVLAAGVGLIVAAAGLDNFLAGLSGYTAATEEAGRMFPSWERIVGQLVLLASFCLAVAICLKLGGVEPRRALTHAILGLGAGVVCLVAIYIAGTLLHVWPVVTSGQAAQLHDPTASAFLGARANWPGLIARAAGLLSQRLRLQAWPLFFAPIALLWLLRRWQSFPERRLRDLCFFLLCLSIAARARRLFEHVDWHHFLFEVPALLILLRLAFPGQTRAVHAASRTFALALLAVGAFSFADWTLTPALGLPTVGRAAWGQPTIVDTAHGAVRFPEQDARAFRDVVGFLNQIDPSGTAPVFSTGTQGAWAYFTGRRNPTPLTYGFSWSNRDPEEVVRKLLAEDPKPIVIDEGTYRRPVYIFPRPAFGFRQWELTYQEAYHTRRDRPLYERVFAQYELVGTADGRLRSWSVYRWKGSRP
ncbi:MAG TPA: hypothetical protein VES67_15475 [Vicinamibacterales bacterium]|nr:hypothetical protein [Vicinamibacterales bacterium]